MEMTIFLNIKQVIILLTEACHTKSNSNIEQKIMLYPISPYSYTFKDPADTGSNEKRTDKIYFFYIGVDRELNDIQRKQLHDLVMSEKKKINGDYNLLSVYVYRKTGELNAAYKGDHNLLLSSHKADLVSYTRWENGTLDIFYVVYNRNVVYDLLENKKVSPPYEFE